MNFTPVDGSEYRGYNEISPVIRRAQGGTRSPFGETIASHRVVRDIE